MWILQSDKITGKVTGPCNESDRTCVQKKDQREKVKIDAMQFGFMPGKGSPDAIFTVRQMQEKYGCKGKKLYFAFVDLEKAFDKSTQRWALRKAGVEEWLVKAVMAMYEGAQTVVRRTEGI